MKSIVTAIILALSVFNAEAIAITGASDLRRDPFSRAKVQQILDANRQAQEKKPKVIRWQPKLLATIVSGDQSMINLDGEIYRLGDTFNRHKLVQVSRYTATFKRGGKYRKIKLYNPVEVQ